VGGLVASLVTGMELKDDIVLEENSKPSFAKYYKTVPKEKANTKDYDLEAAYNELPYSEMKEFATKPEKHLTDKYKKPTHKTFSQESIHHSDKTPGGRWENKDGIDYFHPSSHNITNAGGEDKLKEYFDEHEKGVKLVLPKTK
jgi:hypothetical protein